MAQMCECTAVAGWQQQGPARAYEPDNLFDYMNGNAEGYLIYRFVGMKGITCKSGENTIVIDISEMTDAEYAYGMFTSTRDPRLSVEKIGMAGQVTQRRAIFAKDKYYVELAANPDKDHTAALRAFVAVLEKNITGRTALPEAIAWFPAENLVPNSIRLVPESVLGLRMLKSGYIGQYDFGKAFLVQESSADAAAGIMTKLKERIGQITPVKIADEAFTAVDKYLNGMCVFRKGRFLAGFANLQPGRDVTPEATKLAQGIK
jgi:hypothetical protein